MTDFKDDIMEDVKVVILASPAIRKDVTLGRDNGDVDAERAPMSKEDL
jgi:hypothetical protein